MTNEHARRLADNEVLFREVNERVQERAVDHGDSGRVHAFFCECSRPDCLDRVHLTSVEYEEVRAHGARFILVAGHEIDSIENVVDDTSADLVVVEKHGVAGERAESLDPRGA